jgi:uncharacterized protein with PQ loop repeat
MEINILGTIATASSLVYSAFGLPFQIRGVYKAKSTAGLSLFMISTLFVMTVSWLSYGLSEMNWYLIASNIPGLICATIILIQFYLYRRN